MWAVLAVIVFLAAQVYLLLSLNKADGFLAGQASQRVVWKTGVQSNSTSAFLRYLRQSGGNPS